MNGRIPAMQAIRALEAVARTGSLTRAAEGLHLTHGAISHQLKGLEEDLGVRLVERVGRGVRLTDEGQRFAARWLLPRIGRFLAAHRDIDLDVRASTTLVDFRRDDVEAAIRYGGGNYAGVVAEHLLDDAYFPVCSPRIDSGRLPKAPADLSRYLPLRSENEFWQPWFRAAGLGDWPEPTRGPIFNDASHMMQAAVEGQGIALARSSLIGNDLVNGVLVRLFDVEVPSPFRYYLVYPPRLADSPKLALLRAWLRDEIARDEGGPPQTPRRRSTVRAPAKRKR